MMRSGNDVILFCCDTRGPSARSRPSLSWTFALGTEKKQHTTSSLSLGETGAHISRGLSSSTPTNAICDAHLMDARKKRHLGN